MNNASLTPSYSVYPSNYAGAAAESPAQAQGSMLPCVQNGETSTSIALAPGNTTGTVMERTCPQAPGTVMPPSHTQQMPCLQYLNGFLRTQIGRRVTIESLVGTSLLDRTGVLMDVGANYIILNETETNSVVVCDFYDIRFIHFYY